MDKTIYAFTVPIFNNMLEGLKTVLGKAAAHGLDEQALLAARLAPDMFPLVKQVQVATDHAKGAVARLAGLEPPKFDDTEATLAQLSERIDRALAFIKSVPESAFAGAAARRITFHYFPGKYFTGVDYARDYALPNFFFHVAIVYALVRAQGVAIGKADYVNHLSLQDDA